MPPMERIEEVLSEYRLAVLSRDATREQSALQAVLTEVSEGSARRARAVVERGIEIGKEELRHDLRRLIGAKAETDP